MEEAFRDLHWVHYLPIATTLFSSFFLWHIGRRWLKKGGAHLFWWSLGVFTYGLGTALESLITLFGNSPLMNKLWYVAGAILGGYPLAQGSVYLHLSRRSANVLTAVTLPLLAAVATVVFLSPVNVELLDLHRPGGVSFEWQWLRLLTPFINTYAAIFLIGTAFWSAFRFTRIEFGKYRAVGNFLIAFGAILPGIGGGMAKAGMVEALYVGEFVGILLIFAGYRLCDVRRTEMP